MSEAVPYGLGVIDRDAVDCCTRAWLELLRKQSPAFRSSEGKSWIAGGTESATLTGSIPDVCGASAIYCILRERHEIECRLNSVDQARTSIPLVGLGQVFDRDTRNTADEGGGTADCDAPRLSSVLPERLFRKSGDVWQLAFGGKSVHVKHRNGMTYLLHLLRAPGQELHSMQLLAVQAGISEQPEIGSAGAVLDETGIELYRHRIEDLEDQLAEAERNNDQGRKESAQLEMDRLTEQLTAAVGLGGRRRKASDDAEKLRKGVSMAINRAIRSIREHHVAMADHLRLHIKCGNFFCYRPDDIPWAF